MAWGLLCLLLLPVLLVLLASGEMEGGVGQGAGWLCNQRDGFGAYAVGVDFLSPYLSPGRGIAGTSEGPDLRACYPDSWGNKVVPEELYEVSRQVLSLQSQYPPKGKPYKENPVLADICK